jgi:hypothetical protein
MEETMLMLHHLKELFLVEEQNGIRKRIINPKLTLDHILIIENGIRREKI